MGTESTGLPDLHVPMEPHAGFMRKKIVGGVAANVLLVVVGHKYPCPPCIGSQIHCQYIKEPLHCKFVTLGPKWFWQLAYPGDRLDTVQGLVLLLP